MRREAEQHCRQAVARRQSSAPHFVIAYAFHVRWIAGRGSSGGLVKIHSIVRRLVVPLAAMLAMISSGCGLMGPPATSPHQSMRTTSTVLLHGRPLELHLAAPVAPDSRGVLVLYASGDGGWFGAAVDMFKQIADDGYYVVGFSSKSFLHIERPRGALVDVRELAAEYRRITRTARTALGLDDSVPVVLTGWSRGAAFAVLVASEPAPVHDIVGVVAIGMTAGENLRLDDADDDDDDGAVVATKNGHPLFQPYARIAQLGDRPCAVIQATHDHYLPAPRAHALFGDDTPTRRFYSIDARNHRFSGARQQFSAALTDALHFVVSAVAVVDRRSSR
jgi:dienelactone hydrolase